MDELVIGGEELPAWTLQADVVDGERVRDRAPPGSAPELVASWHNPTASPVRVPAAPWALVRAYVHHTGPNERARGYGYGGGVAVVQADALVWVEVPPGGDVVRTTPWAALVDAQAWSPGRWTLDLVGGDRVAGLAPDQAVPALRGGVELVVRGDSAPAGDLDVALVFRRGGWAMRVHNPGAVDVWAPPRGEWLPACEWTRDGEGFGQGAHMDVQTPFYDEARGIRLAPGARVDLRVPCAAPRDAQAITVTLAPISRLWATEPGPHAEVDRPLRATR